MARSTESRMLLLLLILMDNREGKVNEILKEGGQQGCHFEKKQNAPDGCHFTELPQLFVTCSLH